jgi:hypothetical protein
MVIKNLRMNRLAFLKMGLLTSLGLTSSPIVHAQDRKAPLPMELVKEFVIAGHGNLEKTKQMLEREPNLLNASWDWGNGDFEEAIEGASHVGNRMIAEYLIERGARMNLFTATMLGKIEIVKPMIDNFPAILQSKGPHGLSLIHHAEKGGELSAEVLNYLKSKLG